MRGNIGKGGSFVFCSNRALYPPNLKVVHIIANRYALETHVVAPLKYVDSPVWQSHSRIQHDETLSSPLVHIHFLPAKNDDVERYGFAESEFRQLMENLKPRYIWVHAEFWEGISHQLLSYFRLNRNVSILSHVEINHITGKASIFSACRPFIHRNRLRQLYLWPRLNGVTACATKSKECANRMGLPSHVPIVVNYLPVYGADEADNEGISLPWSRENAVLVGYAGLLSEQKGWKVLLTAISKLPEEYKLVIMGDGDQREELQSRIRTDNLDHRVHHAGLLPKGQLLASYRLLDMVVLPSITTEYSVEQFGAVLAEAMSCGVPVIGSDSGAIPETVGEGGIIVPENDPDSLAEAIVRLSRNTALREKAIRWGLERFRTHYSCEAYAQSIVSMLGIE